MLIMMKWFFVEWRIYFSILKWKWIYKWKFVRNIFTAIAKRITPKNFLMTKIPDWPNNLSNKFKLFNAKNITIKLMKIPIMILYVLYNDLIDIIVVNVPEPAIIGNAIGTIEPDFALASPLKKSWPKTISNPKIKSTIEPAMANEEISKPNIPKNCCPKNKNANIKMPETPVALEALMCPILFFNEIKTGIEPKTSMTANNANVQVKICGIEMSEKLKVFILQKYTFKCCRMSDVGCQFFNIYNWFGLIALVMVLVFTKQNTFGMEMLNNVHVVSVCDAIAMRNVNVDDKIKKNQLATYNSHLTTIVLSSHHFNTIFYEL